MLKRFFIAITLTIACVAPTIFAQTAQRTPTQTTRERTTTTTTTNAPQSTRANTASSQETSTTTTTTQTSRARTAAARRAAANQATSGAQQPGASGVLAAFDALVEGIERADVNAVTAAYWYSPQLLLFNYNGTVTKSWEQLRKNRASSYPEMKDVRLDIRDRRVQMLAPTAALVTCLWTQSQTFRGAPETASGRMTLVYRRVGNVWKIAHLHTSPDMPDPSRVPASEQLPVNEPPPTPQLIVKPTP